MAHICSKCGGSSPAVRSSGLQGCPDALKKAKERCPEHVARALLSRHDALLQEFHNHTNAPAGGGYGYSTALYLEVENHMDMVREILGVEGTGRRGVMNLEALNILRSLVEDYDVSAQASV